jgi:tetratricopeptide (TPR) repeat protein
VVGDEEFDRLVSTSGEEVASEIEGYKYAERLIELGRYEDALSEYMRRYRAGSPYLNDRIADLSLRTSRFDSAIQYWLKNWQQEAAEDSDQNYSDLAISGIIRTCIAKDDHPNLLLYTEPLLNIESSSIDREIVMMVKYLIGKGDFNRAKAALQRYLQRHPDSPIMDQVLFLFGRIYEENTENRNYKMARDAFARVYTDFPESIFADSAKEKADFLNRHFFFVR